VWAVWFCPSVITISSLLFLFQYFNLQGVFGKELDFGTAISALYYLAYGGIFSYIDYRLTIRTFCLHTSSKYTITVKTTKIQARFPLEEGNTPVRQIDGVYYKLENANPTGSVKDRGVSYQVWKAANDGFTKFCISSSGNAAISAAAYVSLTGGSLDAFVSPNINKEKLKKIMGERVSVHIVRKPISDCVKFSKKTGAFNLRASHDPSGWVGYTSVAFELDFKLGKVGSVFIPVSSGTLFYGVARGFEKMGFIPQLHAVQTTSCNLISRQFDQDFKKSKASLADALVARTTPLETKVVSYIKKSEGFGWVVSDKEIKEAWEYLYANSLDTSYEGAASLAAYNRALRRKFNIREPVVCLVTGRYYAQDKPD